MYFSTECDHLTSQTEADVFNNCYFAACSIGNGCNFFARWLQRKRHL